MKHIVLLSKRCREDNGGIYGLMDFSTRDRYRHVVESVARNSTSSEYEVARIAVRLTNDNVPAIDQDQSTLHVGYYLIGAGISQTKKLARFSIVRYSKYPSITPKTCVQDLYRLYLFNHLINNRGHHDKRRFRNKKFMVA